jgi:hypothetical protein
MECWSIGVEQIVLVLVLAVVLGSERVEDEYEDDEYDVRSRNHG